MDAADLEQGAAAAAAMDEEPTEPTPEQRAAMEALGVSHLLNPDEQAEFLRKVQEGMDTGADQVKIPVTAEVRALHEAAEAGDLAAVVAALERVADINCLGEV